MRKNDMLIKSCAQTDVEQNGEVSAEELKLINAFTRRNLSADEVYAFTVVLCDNDIDRDGERFTVDALKELEKLFVGKTGVIDHVASARNQTARVFACNLESVPGQKTADGLDYYRLKARAYMPKSEGNRELMLAIDSGILKEVSVGCSVRRTVCSICGDDLAICPHSTGEIYADKMCVGELTQPYDAYEWSFVAVPAQRKAGVTKALDFFGKESNMDKILKAIECAREVALTADESARLRDYINGLKKSAKDGVLYRESLTRDVVALAAFVQPDISAEVMKGVAEGMSIEQLREFKSAFEKKKRACFEPVPQLYRGDGAKNRADDNGQFRI